MKKLLPLGMAMLAIFFAAEVSSGAVPILDEGERVQYSGSDYDPGSHAAVEIVDWNNDGKMDMVAGYWWTSRILLYLNTGTANAPVFSSSSILQAGGSAISVNGY